MAELQNCNGCGRDTMADSGYCYRCVGRGTQQPNEAKGRSVVTCGYSAAEFNTSSIAVPAAHRFFNPPSVQQETKYFNKMRKIYNT